VGRPWGHTLGDQAASSAVDQGLLLGRRQRVARLIAARQAARASQSLQKARRNRDRGALPVPPPSRSEAKPHPVQRGGRGAPAPKPYCGRNSSISSPRSARTPRWRVSNSVSCAVSSRRPASAAALAASPQQLLGQRRFVAACWSTITNPSKGAGHDIAVPHLAQCPRPAGRGYTAIPGSATTGRRSRCLGNGQPGTPLWLLHRKGKECALHRLAQAPGRRPVLGPGAPRLCADGTFTSTSEGFSSMSIAANG